MAEIGPDDIVDQNEPVDGPVPRAKKQLKSYTVAQELTVILLEISGGVA